MRKVLFFTIFVTFLITGCDQKPSSQNSQSKSKVEEIEAASKEVSKEAIDTAKKDDSVHEVTKEKKIDNEEIKKEEAKIEETAKEEAKKEEAIKKEEVVKEVSKEVKSSIDGAKLYAKCAGCHGAKGEKKGLGKSAQIGGMDKDKLVELLNGYKNNKVNLYGMGALMSNQVKNLSKEEIEALAKYISNLR